MSCIFSLSPFWLALTASLFCWIVTALGAALVFFFRKINLTVMNILTGFAAGVMLAASFWSLLSPAIKLGSELGYIPWLFPFIGFTTGGLFVTGASKLLDYCIKETERETAGTKKRSVLLVSSITLHNIPEGMCAGVAFGAFAAGTAGSSLMGAFSLALGIGLQNFPEGASVSLPLLRDGATKKRAFFLGQLSGIVEPIAAVIGFWLVSVIRAALPVCLSFSAGAMIAVVASELIPEACKENKNFAALGCIVGFAAMMIMDVALG